jgi:aryl-alcohol dehydrogenase-like predicted oxidoreductase
MRYRTPGRTDLQIPPLVLGGNVFGWTADEGTSFRLLDAALDHGLDTIDTADVYSAWVDGHSGGESETIIGKWLAKRGSDVRDRVTLITKVGWDGSLAKDHILEKVEDSLRRLQTDYIDLYFSHKPDEDTPVEETLEAHEELIETGKIRYAGASNYDADQLEEALASGREEGRARYDVLQPEYNLYARSGYEDALEDVAERENLGVISYFALAAGFLTGKYRAEEDLDQSPRGAGIGKKYMNERGRRILSALDEVAASHDASPAQIALAWVMARPSVTAPIASATSVEQLEEIAAATELELDDGAIERLNEASAERIQEPAGTAS